MKYLRLYENIESKDLVLYQMYKCYEVVDETICFVGNIGSMNNPLLFIIFNSGELTSVRWRDSLTFKPLNISINDYIVENNVVVKTLEFIKERISKLNRLRGFLDSTSLLQNMKLYNVLYERLLNDSKVMYHSEMEGSIVRYNL